MRLPLICLASILAACAAAPAANPAAPAASAPLFASASPTTSAGREAPDSDAGGWLTRLDRANPLVGRIWDVRARAFVDEAALLGKAQAASFVLLGEKHDNPDHHRLQARVVAGVARAGKKPAVVLEMAEIAQQPELDAFLEKHPGDAGGLGAALSWEKRGWPAWSTYQPIAEAALRGGLRLWAGNVASSEARAVVKGGLAALGAERVEAWGLRAPLEPAARAALEEELRQSHCGHLPEQIIPGMADAQRARDAALADRMLASEAGAVLIAGAGHARSDRGVPLYLRARRPGAAVVSVAFREVQAGQTEPGDGPHDYLWFTPRLDDDDPCARMPKR